MNYLLQGFSMLKKMKTRMYLSIIGVAVGVAAVILIGYISDAGTEAVNSELDSLGIDGLTISANTKENPGVKLGVDEIKTVRSIESVKNAIPIIVDQTTLKLRDNETSAMLWGIDGGAEQVISIKVLYGREISKSDVFSCSKVCLIDESYAKKIYKRSNIVGKDIMLLTNGSYEPYKVIGVIESGSGLLQNLIGDYIPTFIYIPFTTFQSVTGKGSVDQITVKIKENINIEAASKEIVNTLGKTTGFLEGFKSQNLVTQRNRLGNLLDIVTLILSFISGISLIVAGLGIMTVMTVSVNERTREIGIKKAIGAKRKNIMLEFLTEAIIIAAIGSLAGMIIGSALSFGGAYLIDITLKISYNRYVTSFLFAVAIGGIFGAYPAYKASKLRPVDALRHD